MKSDQIYRAPSSPSKLATLTPMKSRGDRVDWSEGFILSPY